MTSQRLILAVRTDRLPSSLQRTGFVAAEENELWSTLYKAGLWLGPRVDLEAMPSYRQIIPYVTLKIGDRYVSYTRTPAGGESRLHGRVSIGLGGHIDVPDLVFNEADIDLPKTLEGAAMREVDEELEGVQPIRRRWIGFLSDSDSEVGQVHIGVVALWDLQEAPRGAAEEAIGDAGLASLAQLRLAYAGRLEKWSELLAAHLEERQSASGRNITQMP